MARKTRIAHFAGQTATIQNTPPLVTSNKARAKYAIAPRANEDGTPARFDALRAQRLAAPVTVYVEQFSAHPLEADAAELYGPPDGFLDASGGFHRERRNAGDRPVYQIELHPDDGLYPLPYMARQADGRAWEEESAAPLAPAERTRQGFYPDGSRSFEEIDRLSIGEYGVANLISEKADVRFFRVLPPGGYTKGLAGSKRTDIGEGDIPAEQRGVDFFAYKPRHLSVTAPRSGLARAVNAVTDTLSSGDFDGAIWTEGSPTIEETIYWLNLVVDTTLPICGNAAQRPQGQISNDGPKNIVDSVGYIHSRIWADEQGRNRAGAVVIAEQRVFAARAVQKTDARPGGFTATGGHGGILGASGHHGSPLLHYLPAMRHTHCSDVNLTRLPREVTGVRRENSTLREVTVTVKDTNGRLVEGAIPKVHITKETAYAPDDGNVDVTREVDISAMLDYLLLKAPLAGFVIEGMTPYGTTPAPARALLQRRAVYCGLPVVRVGRGNTEGFATEAPPFIAGSNLTATKARMLLMAALLKLGSLPPAADPDHPSALEAEATRVKVAAYQEIFNTH